MKATVSQTKGSKLSVAGKTPRSRSKASPPAELEARIAVSAYYKAEARGFTPGQELDDWLAAEKETNQ
ncbi:DUF2934 domain-containing protein [Nitrosomonas sp. ANs5]|uniref:DUF2934 domain-containing protein n=1 Tax=Nitrosomonas sp. ANs5 TaxID=3423941 RepID=UPI003D34EAEC